MVMQYEKDYQHYYRVKKLIIMKKVNKEALNSKSISFIEKYFPFIKAHAETGISLIDYLKSKTKK